VAEEKEKEKEVEEKKGSPLKLIIIIAVVQVVLVAGGFVVWSMFLSDSGADPQATEAMVQEAQELEAEASQNFPMETFVVNLNDPGGKRYLKTRIALEYFSEELSEELRQRLPQLRDVILLFLSSKGLDDIQGVEGKIALRRELIQRINQVLKTGKIRNLYFTQFVIQ